MKQRAFTLLLTSLITFSQALADESNDSDKSWRISAGGGISLGSTTKGDFDLSRLSTGANLASGEIEYQDKAGLHLDIDVRKTPQNSWGAIFGLSYDLKRELKEMTIKIAGQSDTSNATGDDKIQSTSLYASAVYRWEKFYIPFGFNYTMIDLTTKNDEIDVDGGIGVQVGAGYWFTDNVVGEFLVKAFNVEMTETSQADDMKIKTDGFVNSSARFSVKYVF